MKLFSITFIVLSFLMSITAHSETMSVPYIVDVKILPKDQCNISQYVSPYCASVTYSSYDVNIDSSLLNQKIPPGYGYFGIYSVKTRDNGTRSNLASENSFRYSGQDNLKWADLIEKFEKNYSKNGTIMTGLESNQDGYKNACIAFGLFDTWYKDDMLPTSNTCIPVPRPNVSCSFNVNDINLSYGTLNTNSIDGTTQQKSFVVNCTEDADVVYSLVNNDSSGFVEMTSDTGSSIIYSHLYIDGNSMSSSIFKSSEKEGNNNHQLTATLENSNGAEAGHYKGAAVLIISPQ